MQQMRRYFGVLLLLGLGVLVFLTPARVVNAAGRVSPANDTGTQPVELPPLVVDNTTRAVRRDFVLHTIIPARSRVDAVEYTVEMGDSLFGIARHFGITPETLLWANYGVLRDNPDMLAPGQELKIPPVNGVYYKWKEGDTFESVAREFHAEPRDIIEFVGNHIDPLNPKVEPGQWVMVPGGHRPFKQWVVPTIPRGQAGVSLGYLGPGACPGGYTGAVGTGTFVWPTPMHRLVGNNYGPSHLGLDLGVWVGGPIYAADSGVVVFAGWSNVGYGYMIMIDHGNGYQTLYAHLSQVNVHCGQSVFQGQLIGLGGSTGNSSGPHLHFEVRYHGGFINPWTVLPPP
ncbi:MAG: peptidoglycan DD-metalloendopeptidase family protein [Chloroflexi bacterium]|nr:peptidoglycan DD-metalloendopeptidase family protein [Chloroflexota bacterium]